MIRGPQVSVWDGKDSNGVDVVSGTYKYKVTVVDSAGFSASKEGVIPLHAIDTSAPTISNVVDLPDPLKLGTDGAGNTIKFDLSENAFVTIEIHNINGVLVRTLFNSNLGPGQNSGEWDGKDTAGNLVSDGIHIYKINAIDISGNNAGEVTGTITTDKTPIKISNVLLIASIFK
jgi:flagellar hook assembly protein FlgD